MTRQVILGALAAVLAAALTAGCGMSSGGGAPSATAATQPVGPAAPLAARAEQVAPAANAEPGAQAAVFLRATGGDFETISLSVEAVSLLRAEGQPVALEALSPAEVRANAFSLIAQGGLPAGEYDGVALRPEKAGQHSITFAGGHEPAPLRLPVSLDLKFDAVKVSGDQRLVLVITLDCADLGEKDEVQLAARRFRAGPLEAEQAAGLKGQVAPEASLARVNACWAKTGTVVAATQADPFTGEYALEKLPPGEYYLRVTAAGHQAYQGPEKPVAAAAGKMGDLPTIVLLPAQGLSGR